MLEKTNRFGTILRKKRTHACMSLEQLGGVVGISSTHMSNMERGVRSAPSTADIINLSKALHVPAVELLAAAFYDGRLAELSSAGNWSDSKELAELVMEWEESAKR